MRLRQELPQPKIGNTLIETDALAQQAFDAMRTSMSINGISEREACRQAQISYTPWMTAKEGQRPVHLAHVVGALSLMGLELVVRPIPGSFADPAAFPKPLDPLEQ